MAPRRGPSDLASARLLLLRAIELRLRESRCRQVMVLDGPCLNDYVA